MVVSERVIGASARRFKRGQFDKKGMVHSDSGFFRKPSNGVGPWYVVWRITKQKDKRITKGQAQRLTGLENSVGFAGRWGWVRNFIWRLQDDDFKISVGGYGRNSLVPYNFKMRSSGYFPKMARRGVKIGSTTV